MKHLLRTAVSRHFFLLLLFFLIRSTLSQAQGNLGIVVLAPDQAAPGATIQYTLMVTNSGPGDMTNVAVQMPVAANFTASSVTGCVAGMANNGSSSCPIAANLTLANLQGAGIIVPSIPDGGTVTITVSGTVAAAANYTIINKTATVAATGGQTDPVTTNNTSTYKTTIHNLASGQSSVYRFSSIASTASSPAIAAGGGSFVLVYNLISGPAVPGIGNSFTVPGSYSVLTNRTGNGITYNWKARGPLDTDYDPVFSLVPDDALLFSNLPAVNRADHIWAGTQTGDNFYRQMLSTNAIDPLGVFSITIGAVPNLPALSTSIVQSSSIRIYGSFSALNTVEGANSKNIWSTYAAPIAQPVTAGAFPNSTILTVPYNNTYPFRFSAILRTGATAPADFMLGGFQWANIFNGNIQFWTPNTALPVTWNSFTVTAQSNKALLKWSTASEQNNKGFEIERSADGNTWTNIDFVASKAKDGNSSQLLGYEAVDAQPLQGVNYYRLRQTDIDGRYVYSAIREVSFAINSQLSIHPNPATEYIIIKGLAGNENVKIYDAIGKVVKELKVTGSTVTISLDALPKGIYHIAVKAGDKTETRKLIKR
jgi:uncharacterized repeat protein (TIGR01451 family)